VENILFPRLKEVKMSNSVGIKDGYIPSSKEEDNEPTTKEYLKEILLNQQIILIRLSRIQ